MRRPRWAGILMHYRPAKDLRALYPKGREPVLAAPVLLAGVE